MTESETEMQECKKTFSHDKRLKLYGVSLPTMIVELSIQNRKKINYWTIFGIISELIHSIELKIVISGLLAGGQDL